MKVFSVRRILQVAAVVTGVALGATLGHLRGQETPFGDPNLTYSSGQPVMPTYHGFEQNADGSFTMHFGYMNKNWKEELDVPVGPNNTVSPAPFGPDAGQPTHFLPRNSRWLFTIRVPADFGQKEITWAVTSHGKTYTAFGTLKPGYALDDVAIARVYTGGSPVGNKAPELKLEGEIRRSVKVGQPLNLTATVTDDGMPRGPRARALATAASGQGALRTATGLMFSWLPLRSPGAVRFDPPQFHGWEDERGNSPYAYGWVPPPVPAGNRWVVNAVFSAPGTYVLRGRAYDGGLFARQDVTVTVTP